MDVGMSLLGIRLPRRAVAICISCGSKGLSFREDVTLGMQIQLIPVLSGKIVPWFAAGVFFVG